MQQGVATKSGQSKPVNTTFYNYMTITAVLNSLYFKTSLFVGCSTGPVIIRPNKAFEIILEPLVL
jgi:hypothetical protein